MNKNVKTKWILTWFQADSDDFVNQVDLPLSTSEVKKLFYLQATDSAYGCHIVRASQRIHLKSIVDYEIDLNNFDYFVEEKSF